MLQSDRGAQNCTFMHDPSGILFVSFNWYESSHALLAIVDHMLAMALLTGSYVFVLVELRLASLRWYQLTLLKQSECSSSRMPTCIISIFFLFESPKVLMDVLCVAGLVNVDHTALYRDVTTLLLQLCTATNVVVYFLFSETIRKRVLHLCGVSDSKASKFSLFQRSGSRSSSRNEALQLHGADAHNPNSLPFVQSEHDENSC